MSSWSIPSFRRHRGAVDGLGGLAHLIAPKVTLTPEHLPYGAGSGEGARRAGEVVQLRLRVIHPIGLEPSAPLFNAFDVFGGARSEKTTSELQYLMRHSSAVFCLI